jgi:hypothetical protein
MSTIVRNLGLAVGMLAWGCAAEDDGGTGEPQGTDASSTAPTGDGTGMPSTSGENTSSSEDGGEVSSGAPEGSDGSTGGGSTGEGEADSSGGTGTAGEVQFDAEFMWVADFLRSNCVKCHSNNVNGNLLLPAADITNEEVRLALDGVVATTGLLLVEPFDRDQSQTYLQITNEFGAIFPVEETDRFGAWIDAGAMYYAQ